MTSRYTRLSTAVAVLFMLTGTAFAQKHEANLVEIPFSGSIEDVDSQRGFHILSHFEILTPTIYVTEQGFVFGTNEYGDTGKSVAFAHPDGEGVVYQINAYIFRNSAPSITEINVGVWSGDEFTGPDSPLGFEAFPITHIEPIYDEGGNTDLIATEFAFEDPIAVATNFHAVLFWDGGAAPNDLGMWSTEFLAEPSPYEWEEWQGTWAPVAENWGESWHVYVEALVGAPVSNEPGAEQQLVTLSSIYPNPSVDVSYFDLEVGSVQDLTVEVFNLLGQRVATVFDGTVTPGRTLFDLSTTDLTSGMYIVRVKGEGISQTRRFVVAN